MLQHYRPIQLPLIGTLLLGLLAIAYLVRRKRGAKSNPAPVIIKHSVDTPPNDTLNYWTEEKKRQAKATDLPNVGNLDREK
jgi:hypothetical protein